jgi:hypothetical protein
MPDIIGEQSIFEQPDFLEGQFRSFLDKPSFTSNQRRFFGGQFNDILSRFRNALAQNQFTPFGTDLEFQKILGTGEHAFAPYGSGPDDAGWLGFVEDPDIPELTFQNFLSQNLTNPNVQGNFGADFQQRFANTAPSIAGRQTSRFAPRARFLNF